MEWSKEQRQAIDKKGKNLLVSASAGSGKTTVLVERIMNKLRKGEVNVNELLIVTFTEASAKEMKQRLRTKLLSDLRLEGNNPHLKKQLMLLPNAYISTFHAFCNRVIKKYFYLIDADSKYQIAEEMELFLIKDEAIEHLFLSLYEAQDQNFLRLVDRFTKSRSDDALKTLVLDLYDRLRNIPDQSNFNRKIQMIYENFTSLSDFVFKDELFQAIETKIKLAQQYFKTAYRLAIDPVADHAYKDLYKEDQKILDELSSLCDQGVYDAIYTYLNSITFKRFNSKAADTIDSEIKEMISSFRDKGKKVVVDLQKKYFAFHEEKQVKFIKENWSILSTLLDLVYSFEKDFKKAKKERGLVDFSDLEEMTLAILSVKDGDNEAVLDYKNTFKEILIDEYQDTNSMQEAIISLVSKEDNRFMVGDVKQSIYRFRNAEPEIFQQKHRGYQENSGGDLITLNANYRSRKEVIDFINFLFVQLMDEEIGEIAYDERAELKVGATYYPELKEPLVHLSLIDQEEVNDNDEEDVKKLEMEAHLVAQKIRAMIDEGMLVYDKGKGEMRPVLFKDMVILSRSVKNEQAVFNEVFKKYHIPLLTSDLTGYFDSIEVLTVTSLLEIIDNPLQDIPLAAVLRSPFYGVNEKDFVEIHACSKEIGVKSQYFYDKVKNYVKNGKSNELIKKLNRFFEDLTNYREVIKNESLSELLFRIYHQTNYYDFVKGQPGGRQRQANLDLLYERAKTYEDLTNNSLFKFVQLIKFLKERDKDLEQARTVSENEDLVRFISIHKSKGLEFPIVFLINLSKRYNTQDQKDVILFDKDLGIASQYFDFDYRVEYPSLYAAIIKDRMQQKLLAEEMRLLYVALTRAQERLYLIGTLKSPDIEIKKFSDILVQEETLIDPSLRLSTNYLDLILMALMRHPVFVRLYSDDPKRSYASLFKEIPSLKFEVINQLNFDGQGDLEETLLDQAPKNYDQEFKRRLNFTYPQLARTNHFAKMSVSDMKRLEPTPKGSYQSITPNFRKPKFVDDQSATKRGTSYHQFMQHVDLTKDYQQAEVEALKMKLIKEDILSEEALQVIKTEDILNFLAQPLTKTFREALEIKKELPFTTLAQAKDVYHGYPFEDDILIQGVMDCLIVYEDRVYLLDFKTDRIEDTEESVKRIKKEYQTQIYHYQEAVKRLYPHKKVEAFLYLFAIDRFVNYEDFK